MAKRDKPGHATIIPTLRYKDAPAAIAWLCRAFGFSEHLIVPGDDAAILHAQLVLGNGMIMLGSVRDDAAGAMQKTPAELGGASTHSAYIIVPDADAHCHRAVKAGAEILTEVEDQPYGGRSYSCRDPEGYVWHFGTYDPWA